MRKQMKIAAVVSAAALLAIGASFTSMAAEKGTWKPEDGEWYCYDKDGEPYEDTFCLSNGKEFYVNEDGVLEGSRWVEDGDAMYYVNSAGEKIVNDWRLATPYEDEDADEEWFYFQSSGKRAENKKLVINGKTYYFNSEGEMMTGWVAKDGDNYEEASTGDISADGITVVYCNEDGSRGNKIWVKAYEPGTDEEDGDVDEDDMNYYYIKASGEAATGKQKNINGQTYFFDADGVMLSGWVAGTSSYAEIWSDDEDAKTSQSLASVVREGKNVYFCGDEEDGHMKKNKWIKVWNSVDYGEADDDNDEYWFYIKNNGVVYVPDAEDTTSMQKYKLDDVSASVDKRFVTSDKRFGAVEYKINGEVYLFDSNGQMKNGFVEMTKDFGTDETPNMQTVMCYYGGSDDGARKDGSFTVNDENGEAAKCYFATKTEAEKLYFNAAGINGAKSGKLYANGVLVKATDNKYETKDVTIAGTEYTFIVNKSGSIQDDDDEYKEDGDVLIDATDWTFNDAQGALNKSVNK